MAEQISNKLFVALAQKYLETVIRLVKDLILDKMSSIFF